MAPRVNGQVFTLVPGELCARPELHRDFVTDWTLIPAWCISLRLVRHRFHQGQKHTPGPQKPGKKFNCRSYSSPTAGGQAIVLPGSRRKAMETARPVA